MSKPIRAFLAYLDDEGGVTGIVAVEITAEQVQYLTEEMKLSERQRQLLDDAFDQTLDGLVDSYVTEGFICVPPPGVN